MADIMKLGRDTGSLVNYVYGNKASKEPEVGMGATILGWSDRHAATIIEVFTKGARKYVRVQEDNAIRTDKNGMSEDQTYEYSPNPEGPIRTFKLKGDRWINVGPDPVTRKGLIEGNGYGSLLIGRREKYHDFSF